jgi:hypothetical protein
MQPEMNPMTLACQRAAMTPQAFLDYLAERVFSGGCVPGMWIPDLPCPVHPERFGQCYCAPQEWERHDGGVN